MCTRDHRRHKWGPWRWVDAKKGPCQRRRCGRCGLRETQPDPLGFKKLAKAIRTGTLSVSPETERLAKLAVQRQEEWNARRAKMTPEELKADDEAWAARLAKDIARCED